MKLLPLLLLTAAITAQADTRVVNTLLPCPNGPGTAVVVVDEDGNQTWAGCWGWENYDEPEHKEHREREERRRY